MRLLKFNLLPLYMLLILLLSATSSVLAQSDADLIVHYVEGQPRTGEYAYNVAVYFSAFNAGGDPIRDLPISNVNITEDGKRVDITAMELTGANESINLVVAIDTSGSMRGAKMDAARSAAAQFISGLGTNDLAAVMSFNSQVKTEIGFTDDLDAAREKVDSLNSVEGGGTCFYDALYEAITLSATLPIGRRAIIILTDGVDELVNGSKCSKYREEDVIDLAKAGGTRVPIYTVGLGSRVEAAGLQRIADSTGGRYQFAADEQKLQGLFGKLLEQLHSQYRATYISIAAPGPHQLVLEAKIDGQPIRELRDFVLPNFPYSILVNSPKADEPITGKTKFSVQIIGQGAPITRVEFLVDGKSVGAVASLPYEFEWNPAADLTGEAQITIVALGANGDELARSKTFQTRYELASAEATPTTVGASPTATIETTAGGFSNLMLIPISVVGILILGVMIAVIIAKQRRKQKKNENLEGGSLAGYIPSSDALGVLLVLQSDDQALTGQRFEITKPSTTLGRRADNDILFPKDTPVSRHHAIIEERNSNLFLSEVLAMDEGVPKRPGFGTFVNGQQLEGAVMLKSNDEIRLGKRVRLLFSSVGQGNERTMDELDSIDGEKTSDEFDG